MSRWVASCLVLLLTVFALGQEHQGVLYKLPKGWQESDEGDAKVFTPKGLKEGEIVVVILTPAVDATDEQPAKQFETVVAAANSGSKVLAAGEVQSKVEGGITVCIQAMQLDSPEVGKHSRICTMLFSAKKRALAIVMIKPDDLATKYQEGITDLMASFKLKGDAAAAGGTPTGDTPGLYPGMPGWLPSGKGVPIPAPAIIEGKPQGIWWSMSYGNGQKAMTFVFAANGMQASNPRYGGGALWDMEGQKKQPGANGVGPFSISGGKITRDYDGFHNVDPYATGTDASGKFFKIGGGIFRPLSPTTKASITGTWRASGSKYVFSADGTYEFGQVTQGDGWAAGSQVSGTFNSDGYLVTLRRTEGQVIVQPMGMVSKDLLLINGIFYKKG